MATWYLINCVTVRTNKYWPGAYIDDSLVNTAPILAQGGILEPSSNATVAAAALIAQSKRRLGASEADLTAIMLAAASISSSGPTGPTGAAGPTGPTGATGTAGTGVQKGTTTLSMGTATVTGVTLTSSSKITVTYNTPSGTLGLGLDAPAANRNTGTGQFVINSIGASGATVTTDNSTVDWHIAG
jgi:hypothetical protein